MEETNEEPFDREGYVEYIDAVLSERSYKQYVGEKDNVERYRDQLETHVANVGRMVVQVRQNMLYPSEPSRAVHTGYIESFEITGATIAVEYRNTSVEYPVEYLWMPIEQVEALAKISFEAESRAKQEREIAEKKTKEAAALVQRRQLFETLKQEFGT